MEISELNKTEHSLFTLYYTFIDIQQLYEALKNSPGRNIQREVVVEYALIHLILIKTCSYLDEWHEIFGPKTEEVDREQILKLKRLVKPAITRIDEWKQLKEFRNEIIAHNNKNKNGENVILMGKQYNVPEYEMEILLLLYCLNHITFQFRTFFPEQTTRLLHVFEQIAGRKSAKADRHLSPDDVQKEMDRIDKLISDNYEKITGEKMPETDY